MERPRVRQRVDLVPHMPALIPAELAQWMEDRQADLQEGSQFGRHQSHFGADFEVERGRRTIGGDERWHVVLTRQLYGYRGVRIGEAPHPGPRHKRRRRVVAHSVGGSEPEATLLDALEQDLVSPTVARSERAVGGATHDMTLVNSSDDDALFIAPGPAAARARPGSVNATPQSIQDREWEPTVLWQQKCSQCPTMQTLRLQLCRVPQLEGPVGFSFLSFLPFLDQSRTTQDGQVAAGLQCWSLMKQSQHRCVNQKAMRSKNRLAAPFPTL